MATIERHESQSTQSDLFPVEWPLAQTTTGNIRQPVVCSDSCMPRIKRRKIEQRNIVEQIQPCLQETNSCTRNWTQTCDKPSARELDIQAECQQRHTSISDTKCLPRLPPAVSHIFKSLNHDEASWLAEEVNEANKSIFVAEQTAQKLKQGEGELDNKKASLCALKGLLGDLRRNIKYPDEETAKDLDTLDEVSANFGVRNMVNCLGVLENYLSELQKHLEK